MYESSDGFYEFIVHATYWSFLITCIIMAVHVYTFCICVYRSYGLPFISKKYCVKTLILCPQIQHWMGMEELNRFHLNQIDSMLYFVWALILCPQIKHRSRWAREIKSILILRPQIERRMGNGEIKSIPLNGSVYTSTEWFPRAHWLRCLICGHAWKHLIFVTFHFRRATSGKCNQEEVGLVHLF